MALRKIFFVLLLTSFCSFAFCGEDGIVRFINSALERRPEVQKIKNDLLSVVIQKKQYDYQWIPVLQLDFPQSAALLRGDDFSVMNQKSSSKHMLMLEPAVKFSLQQKLPGNGSFSIYSTYDLNYLPERRAYLQNPSLGVSFAQTISTDSFMFGKNSEALLMKAQTSYKITNLKKSLYSELADFISLLAEYDSICAELAYNKAQVDFYSAKERAAGRKNKNGSQSNLEFFYARHSLQNFTWQLKKSNFAKNELEQKITQLYDSFNFLVLEEGRESLMEILDSGKIEFESDERLFESLILQNKLNYKKDELSFKPQFYFSAGLCPDTNFYYQYSDWKKSWRSLIEPPPPIKVNAAAGVRINFELPKAKKMRKEIYELEEENIRNKMRAAVELQEKNFLANETEILSMAEYFYALKNEFASENSFRQARKEMLEKQMLTEEDFFESEITYFTIRQDYINTFWSIIKKRLEIIESSSAFDECINIFFNLEDFYGKKIF